MLLKSFGGVEIGTARLSDALRGDLHSLMSIWAVVVPCGHGHSGRQQTHKGVFHAGLLTERQQIKANLGFLLAKPMEMAEPMLTRVLELRRVVPTAGPDLVFRRTTSYVLRTISYVNLRYRMFT